MGHCAPSDRRMKDSFDHARREFLDGTGHLQAGRLEAAERCFETSLALLPGRVSTLVNLAATRLRLGRPEAALPLLDQAQADRKSTRLNSSHSQISYAVFCLKK